MRHTVAMLLYCLPFIVLAQEALPPDLANLPQVDVPPRSQRAEDDNTLPEVTIMRQGKKVVQEFRRGGQLYMIKIVPDIGAPYYFLDTNGDGKLDVRSSDLDKGSHVNLWTLLEWN
jgi:hypothetical protein